MHPGLGITEGGDLPGRLDRRQHHSDGRELADDEKRDQMSEEIEFMKDLLSKGVLLVSVEEDETEEGAVVIHRQGIT